MNQSTNKNESWQRILEMILAENSELQNKTAEERMADFDRLSEKIAQNLPYNNREEFERAMRPRRLSDILDSTTWHPCHFSQGDNIDRKTTT